MLQLHPLYVLEEKKYQKRRIPSLSKASAKCLALQSVVFVTLAAAVHAGRRRPRDGLVAVPSVSLGHSGIIQQQSRDIHLASHEMRDRSITKLKLLGVCIL